MPLSGPLAAHARRHPARRALRMGAQHLDYARLAENIARRYSALIALPRRPRDIAPQQPLVALALGNHPAAPAWAALALAAPVTLALIDPSWPPALQAAMIERLAPDLVVTPDKADFGLEATPFDLPATQADQPLFIGFTSGTTARPKAFLRTRASWRESLRLGQATFGLEDGSHTLAPGPLVHGLTFYALAETLHAGACFTGMERFAAAQAHALLAAGDITRLVAVPTMLEGLCRVVEACGAPLPLATLTTAGAALPRALLERLPKAFPRAGLFDYYGASELGFVALAHHAPGPDGTLRSEARGVGRPFPGVTIEIRRNGAALPAGEIGTVFVSSPHPIEGYLLAEGESAFLREGAFASVGDLGSLDAAGNLTLMGRADGMVITGGYNVYPQEVAQVLGAAPGVRMAEVLAVPDAYLGEKLVAVVQTEAGAEALAEFCAARLPRYKIPRAFFATSDWPLTTSGKVARATLSLWITQQDARLTPLA